MKKLKVYKKVDFEIVDIRYENSLAGKEINAAVSKYASQTKPPEETTDPTDPGELWGDEAPAIRNGVWDE